MMKRKVLIGVAVASCLLLASCKLRFDQAITCPQYEANGVAVWKVDTDTYVVIHPDKTKQFVDDTGCVVEYK